jgi:hypothetical protein
MLIALLSATLLGGQTAPDRTCLDDNGRDVCAPAMRVDLLQRLGTVSAEEEAAAGVESYRAFFVDGYGRDMPSFSFERRPGTGPMSVVYGFGGARLEAPISERTWAEVIARGEFADRALVEREPEAASGTIAAPNICLHAWNTVIEMTNSPATRWRTTPVRRRSESACNGALATRYAFFLAERTLEAQPHCQGLDQDFQRNAITTVAICLALKGDRLAAAGVYDQVRDGGPRPGADPLNPYVWQAWLGTNGSPRLNWAGETVVTQQGRDRNVAEFVIARLRQTPDLRFYPAIYDAGGSRSVVVTGKAEYSEPNMGGEERRLAAAYSQTWVWDPNLSEWMVSDWTVEPFTPAP